MITDNPRYKEVDLTPLESYLNELTADELEVIAMQGKLYTVGH